jgi:hypothetical protein
VIRTLLFATLLPLVRAQSPPIVVTNTAQPDGHVLLTIENQSGSALTAYYWVRRTSTPAADGTMPLVERHYKDSALDRSPGPIPPHQQGTVTVENGVVTLVAGLFADGTSFGDPQWVARMRDRRDLAQKHIETAMNVLQQALDTDMEKPNLVQELQTIIDGITPGTVNQDDVGLIRRYYQTPLGRVSNPNSKRPLRELLQIDLNELEEERERFQLYR